MHGEVLEVDYHGLTQCFVTVMMVLPAVWWSSCFPVLPSVPSGLASLAW